MKVLIISSNVKQSNSVGKIATELSTFLNKNSVDTKIMYFSGSIDNENCIRIRPQLVSSIVYRTTQFSRYTFVKTPYAISKIKKMIKEYEPDVIHLVQPLIRFIDNKELFKAIGETGIPCVYSMIDENAYLGNCDNAYECEQFKNGCQYCNGENKDINSNVSKCWRWNKYGSRRVARNKEEGYKYIENICFVAPEWVVERAKASHMLGKKEFCIIDEYVNNEKVYYPRIIENNIIIAKYGIDIKKIIIVNVARYSNPRKGIKYFIELAKMLENNEKFLFVNIGYDGPSEDLPTNYLAVPFVSNQDELADFYSIADLAMITSLSDTMPNTSLEALSCGTPVCGFDITGIPYVADEPLGIYVEPRNVKQLAEVVTKTTKKSKDISDRCREYALKRYSPEVSGNKMLALYNNMLSHNKEEKR